MHPLSERLKELQDLRAQKIARIKELDTVLGSIATIEDNLFAHLKNRSAYQGEANALLKILNKHINAECARKNIFINYQKKLNKVPQSAVNYYVQIITKLGNCEESAQFKPRLEKEKWRSITAELGMHLENLSDEFPDSIDETFLKKINMAKPDFDALNKTMDDPQRVYALLHSCERHFAQYETNQSNIYQNEANIQFTTNTILNLNTQYERALQTATDAIKGLDIEIAQIETEIKHQEENVGNNNVDSASTFTLKYN